MSRGSLVFTTVADAVTDWNTCTVDMVNSCAARGEEEDSTAVEISLSASETSFSSTTCRFQVADDSTVNVVMDIPSHSGTNSHTFDGAIADNNETIILRGKYEGSDITDPDPVNAPERPIKEDLALHTLVGIAYEGTLTADADTDGIDNLGEFTWASVTQSKQSADVDGDGDLDFIQYHPAGIVKVYDIDGSANQGSNVDLVFSDNTYTMETFGDYDGDEDIDYLFQNASGEMKIVLMDYKSETTTLDFGTINTKWEIHGSGDFDGDGDDDIGFYDPANGMYVVQIVEDGQRAAGHATPAFMGQFQQTSYRPVAIGDVDGDGDDDLFWVRYDLDNFESVVVWWSNYDGSANLRDTANDVDWLNAYYNNNYKIRGVGDFDGDGDDDVVWYNTADGNTVAWEISDSDGAHNGTRPQRDNSIWMGTFANLSFEIIETGDTNSDGVEDLIWYNSSNGATNVWEIENLTSNGNKPGVLGSSNTAYVPAEKDYTRRY
jgi:hypothetical protein